MDILLHAALASIVSLVPLQVAVTGEPGSVDEKLDHELSAIEEPVGVFVRMEDQLFAKGGDYERFCADQPDDCKRLSLRAEVMATLKAKAARSLERVQGELDALVEAKEVRKVAPYWIVNGFACKATAEGCAALAELPGVSFVYRQKQVALHRRSIDEEVAQDPATKKLYQELIASRKDDSSEPFEFEGIEVPWNLEAVGATKAWKDHGVTGKGVVIAVLDDGMMTIPTLLPALWMNPDEKLNGKDDDGNGFVDDVFGYDFKDNTPYAVTPMGHRHGTLCASVVAARPTAGEDAIAAGVAPRAKVMPLLGQGQFSAYEYALEEGADILSMSYTFEPKAMAQLRGLYRTAHEHLAAAGVISVGGAGNYAERRPVGEQIGSTKDVPCVIAAAGVGPEKEVTAFSSRGPVSWKGIRFFDEADDFTAKPDVTACNSGFPMWTHRDVWTGDRANRVKEVMRTDEEGYVLVVGPRGNSFAGPHAAGVAALMLEANPELPAWRLHQIMMSTCADMGEPGHDTTSGAGMLQAHKAVAAVLGH